MTLKTRAWDTAEYLRTPEDIVAYLEAVLDEGADDPAFLVHAIATAARAHGMSRLAEQTGITRRGLYKALGDDGNPSFATIHAVLHAMGVRIRADVAPAPKAKSPRPRRGRIPPRLAAGTRSKRSATAPR